MAISAIPILPVESISGNQFRAIRIIEEATQTFKQGTPVLVTAGDGGIAAWTGTATGQTQGNICGISYEAASNLASTGKGAPTPFSPLLGLGSTITFGSVPNQTAAVNIPHGAPINDGRVGFILPTPDVIFSAIVGNAGNPATPVVTNVGKQYGLTADTAGNFWYVDTSKTTLGTNVVVTVIGLDPRDVPAAGTRVLIQFVSAYMDLLG